MLQIEWFKLFYALFSCEVLQALKALGSEVCPGENGLIRCVFLQYWDIIVDDLTSFFKISFYSRAMPEEWKEGFILSYL